MTAFEQILSMKVQVQYQAPERRVLCPIDWYPLEETERGLHCKACGFTEIPTPPPYVPRLPENPQ